jgi:hypothetical protein
VVPLPEVSFKHLNGGALVGRQPVDIVEREQRDAAPLRAARRRVTPTPNAAES